MSANTIMKNGFPDNLYYDMTGRPYPKEPPEDLLATMMYLLYRLPENKANMVLSRYRDGLSFRSIGEMNRVTASWAEATVSGCVRTMGAKTRFLRDGIKKVMDINRNAFEASEREKIVKECLSQCRKEGYDAGYADAVNGMKDSGLSNLLFDTMTVPELCLSNRATNALSREGINTVSDIIRLGNNLGNIRSLGFKSLNEIIKKLNEIGVDVKKHFSRILVTYKIRL